MSEINSSRSKSRAQVSGKSLPLFPENSSNKPLPGSLNDDLLVRGVVTASIKQSNRSRDQIADQMSALLSVPVTARMITSFTAESKELHRWPGAWDRAFCAATGDDTLLLCRVEAAGYRVIKGEEIQLLELGKQYLRRKRADEQAAMLERQLAGVDL
ncbi:MAG: hypothetical protein P4K93_07510 [Terracidiphilus sp.]|nr:hypothetical protein [Terracidiphilus sp.]